MGTSKNNDSDYALRSLLFDGMIREGEMGVPSEYPRVAMMEP